MAQNILTEVDQGVGIVTLNRPERQNTLDIVVATELMQALARMGADPAVRVVVLSSTGKHFCAGSAQDRPMAERLDEMLDWLARLPKPTVARIQGPVGGSGAGLVAACDIAVASFDARFALSEGTPGTSPPALPHLIAAIGERRARRYLLTGESLSASEAYRIGLVHEIVPDEEGLDLAVGQIVDALLGNNADAMAESKRLIAALSGRD